MRFDMTKSKAALTGALLLASVIWGAGVIFMQICIDGGLETGLQMFFRFWVGTCCLGILLNKKLRQISTRLVVCSLLCGTLLFFSFFILTLGLESTTPANSAFLSASSVMLVPFISWVMLKIRPEKKVFAGCFLCLLGVAILSLQLKGGLHFTVGDSLSLLSAVFFSLYTCTVAKVSGGLDASLFTFVQLLVTALWSTVTLPLSGGFFGGWAESAGAGSGHLFRCIQHRPLLPDPDGRSKKSASYPCFADSQLGIPVWRGIFRSGRI